MFSSTRLKCLLELLQQKEGFQKTETPMMVLLQPQQFFNHKQYLQCS